MEGVANAHGIRPRRKEDIVDWLVRVLCKLEYYDHGLLTYAGVVTLLERNVSALMWDGIAKSYGWEPVD